MTKTEHSPKYSSPTSFIHICTKALTKKKEQRKANTTQIFHDKGIYSTSKTGILGNPWYNIPLINLKKKIL